MANARLMQQTLAQFEIEVSLGDITKGPTITRYELHPAPGVKLEKITALSNNIAAALKAERIHILAPVPAKAPSASKCRIRSNPRSSSAICSSPKNGATPRRRFRLPSARTFTAIRSWRICPKCRTYSSPAAPAPANRCHQLHHHSLLYKFSPDQLRFVMIDPKVVELQQYNALPHLVVPVVTDPKK